jgi:outer membrane immunogenic protein
MKKALSVAALVLALTGSALAADLPSYKAPPPPPLPPPPLWTGFYVGLNAGGTWQNSNSISVATFPIFANNPAVVPVHSLPAALSASGIFNIGNSGGFIGGGQIGYNWQFYNSFVAGVEADIQGIAASNGGGTGLGIGVVGAPSGAAGTVDLTAFSLRKNVDYIGTVRGRLGWLFTPTLLVYGTGGLAYGGVSTSASYLTVNPAYPGIALSPGWGAAGSYSDTRVGWTVGGGLEWMFMPHWSAKVEYLYYDLGSVSYPLGLAGSVVLPGGAPEGQFWFAQASQVTTRFNGNIVRAGVNYHFNWGAPPVVAKY